MTAQKIPIKSKNISERVENRKRLRNETGWRATAASLSVLEPAAGASRISILTSGFSTIVPPSEDRGGEWLVPFDTSPVMSRTSWWVGGVRGNKHPRCSLFYSQSNECRLSAPTISIDKDLQSTSFFFCNSPSLRHTSSSPWAHFSVYHSYTDQNEVVAFYTISRDFLKQYTHVLASRGPKSIYVISTARTKQRSDTRVPPFTSPCP